MDKASAPVGVFDSGLGGLSVLKRLMEVLPNEDYIYFGDSKNAPYGVRTKEEVASLTIEHTNMLLDMGAKAICIACNTATSAAVANLRKMYPNLPLVGIEPAIKPAAESGEHPRILVMATPMTIREEKFQNLLARFNNKAEIIQLPCPGLMEFIERGILSGPQLREYLETLLKDYIDTPLDGVVLGCTHYPFVRNEISAVLHGNPTIYDGALGTAKELKRRIMVAGIENPKDTKGSLTILNSDPLHIDMANAIISDSLSGD